MAKWVNGFPSFNSGRQVTSLNRTPGITQRGIYSGIIYGYKTVSGIMSIVHIRVRGSGEGEGGCTWSATGDGDAETASAVLSGRWSDTGDHRRKGGTYWTRNTTSSQPFCPRLLTWTRDHLSLCSWLFIGLDLRRWWVCEDGIGRTGRRGDARRRRHLWWR